MYGPNGFYREFKGKAENNQPEVTFEYERNKLHKNTLTGSVLINLINPGNKPCTVTLTDNAYKAPAQRAQILPHGKATLLVDLTKSMHWYDLSVRVDGDTHFESRFAGRVETGNPGFTDPLMGRMV